MNKELDKIKLWLALHGKTATELNSMENCFKCQHWENLTSAEINKCVSYGMAHPRKWAKIIGKLLVDVQEFPPRERRQQLDQYWTCFEFIYNPKK